MNTEPEIEAWGTVPDFDGVYSASTLGRVRRDKDPVKTSGIKGGCKRYGAGYIFSPTTQDFYLVVGLKKNGKHVTKHVHSLVAAAFIGPRPDGMVVNHKNGIKVDNRLSNLEYLTPSENSQHAVRLGLQKGRPGENAPMAKLNVIAVRAMRECESLGWSRSKIATAFRVGRPNCNRILDNTLWKDDEKSISLILEREEELTG